MSGGDVRIHPHADDRGAPNGHPLRRPFGLGAPVVAAVAWALFASPRAALPVPGSVQLAVQLGTFAVAVAALALAGRPQLAWGLGIAAAANAALLAWWQQ